MKSSLHYLKPVDELVFSDDFMFGAVMRNPDICKGVLERLLKIAIDHLDYPELQKAISPYYTQHGVRLDVYVANSDRVFDVECQTYDIPYIGKRTRYYHSMIDADSLMKGTEYSDLKESYVLFLCKNDPFDKGLPVYTFSQGCHEDGSVDLQDRTHTVIYNCKAAEKEKDPELKAFLSFMGNNTASSDFTREISSMVETKKFEQSFLNEYMAIKLHENDVLRRGREEGRQEGIQEGMQIAARNMLDLGLSISDISKATGLSESEIAALQ